MNRKRILVTGGTGYIGSHVAVELVESGYEPVIVDNLSNSSPGIIDRIETITGFRPEFRQVDCCDYDSFRSVFEDFPEFAAVIHFAAFKAVGESCEKPLKYYRNNILSLVNLLELMEAYSVKGLVFSSSCTVYGQPASVPVTESSPIVPANSPYGNTKQICEEIIHDTIASGSPLRSILLRYFNPIGAHPSGLLGEFPNGVPQNLVPFITQTAMGIRDELSVFGGDYNTEDGSCIRDYIDVVDLAKAHVAAVSRSLEEGNDSLEVFNLGTGKGVSVLEMIRCFEKANGLRLNYKIVGRRAGDVEKVFSDSSKAKEVLGWTADTPLEETLANAWRWQQRLRFEGIQ